MQKKLRSRLKAGLWDKEVFKLEFKEPVGYTVKNSVEGMIKQNKAVVWIKKTPDGVRITTSYPVE